MTLVQIGLPRARAPSSTLSADAAEGSHQHIPEAPGPKDSLVPASAGLVLAGGLILLAPLALLGRESPSALALLLSGLVILGLIAALLRAKIDPP